MNITKEIWKGGTEEMEKLPQYVKEIELYNKVDKWIRKRMILDPIKKEGKHT
jgi:hypothetical protein